MTEDEAMDQECIGPPNCGHKITRQCVGSACGMAWRWEIGDPKAKESKGGILLPRNLWPGYCGLAGKP